MFFLLSFTRINNDLFFVVCCMSAYTTFSCSSQYSPGASLSPLDAEAIVGRYRDEQEDFNC